jgi:hypothetical protein
VLGIVVADLAYQAIVAWRAWHILERAQPEFLILAVLNQLVVYWILVPAMQRFYGAAGIALHHRRTFGMLATGLAVARIIPVGEYVVWRAATRKLRGGASATTQWLILYYAWMFAGLVLLFMVFQVITFVAYPNAHVKSLVGLLRYLPVLMGVLLVIIGVLLATQVSWVQRLIWKVAFDRFGSRSVWPWHIVRDRKLGRYELGALSAAAVGMWLVEGFTMFLCLYSLNIRVPLVIAMFGFTFARLFALLPLTPGGIGIIETGAVLFFAAYGYPVGPVFTAVVIYRLITYWPALLVGAGVYLADRGVPISVALSEGYARLRES